MVYSIVHLKNHDNYFWFMVNRKVWYKEFAAQSVIPCSAHLLMIKLIKENKIFAV
jgi:hypothetical protein